MEFLFDTTEVPIIQIKNCQFYEFSSLGLSRGFTSIFSMAPFSGKLEIENTNVSNSYFPYGFVQFSNILDNFYENRIDMMISSEYGININNLEESFEFHNIKFINYNQFFKESKYQTTIFYFYQCKAKIVFDSLQFDNVVNSNIIMLKGSNKGNFSLKNMQLYKLYDVDLLNIDYYINDVSINSIIIDNITNTQSFIFLNEVNLVKISCIQISNLKIREEIGAIMSTNTNLNIVNSSLENCSVMSIIYQIGMSLVASFLDFTNISFSRSIIYLFDIELFDLKASHFAGLRTNLSLFYVSMSEILNFTSILIESSFLFSIFFIEKTKMLSINDLVAKNNILQMFWKEDQTCDLTFIKCSQIRNNVFSSRLYYVRNPAIKSRIFFDQVMISSNNFTSMNMINIWSGFANLQKFWAINNFFLNVPLYSYSFAFQGKVVVDFQNSYIENCGVLSKKDIYLAFTDNVFIYFWSTLFAYLKNIVFVVTELIDLDSGFISGSPTGYNVELIGNKFLTISTNSAFGYKAILFEGLKYLRLEDNIFHNSRCNLNSFSHLHGAIFISGSSSYAYSKNDYFAYINNNKFYNTSCYKGGNIAIVSISKVEIKNCYFENSSSTYFGGSMAAFSIRNLYIANLSTFGSVANEGGAFYFQNILYSIFSNFSVHDVLARKNGVIFIKYVQSLEFYLCESSNTTSLNYGGFMFLFGSNINMTNGNIKFTKAKEGGAFFFHGSSNVTFLNIFISASSAEEAGGMSFYDVNEIMIKSCKMEHLIGSLNGAAVVLDVFKKAIFQNFIIEFAFSKGVGVVFSKGADENSIMIINTMTCKQTYAKIGSCLYHLSAAPIDILNLHIEQNGNYPLFFRWSFSIQINLSRVKIFECNIDSNLIFISGININLIDLFASKNNAGDSLIYAQSSILTLKDSKFIDNNSSAFHLEDSIFEIDSFAIINSNAFYKLSFLFSSNSKGELKNVTMENLNSVDNIMIKIEKGSLKLIEITCKNSIGRFLTLTRTNLNFSNSSFYNLSTNDQTANEILYINDNSNEYYIDMETINVTCFQSVSYQFYGRLNVFIRNSFFEFAKLKSKSAFATAISGENLIGINIWNSSFINFTKNAISLKTDPAINSVLNIFSSNFLKNEGPLGGAVFLIGNIKILIEKNTFKGNQALAYKFPIFELEGIGGCVFYKAFNSEFEFQLLSNNFSDNFAFRFFSTVFSQSRIYLDNLNIFGQNSDHGYIMSFPIKTRLASNKPESPIIIVSGTPFDFKLELVDLLNRTLFFDSSTLFNSKVSKKQVNHTVLIENSIGSAKSGLITFNNFKIKTNPNSNFSIIISGVFNGLQSKFINEQFIETEYSFHARECKRGEIILADYSCFKCLRGSYSLIDPMVIELKYQRCYMCSNNVECLGGNILVPYPGFYRKSNMSINVVSCFNSQACLGFLNGTDGDLIHGTCLQGNSDNLCFYCEFDYGRFNKQDFCSKCDSIINQIYIRLIFYGFFMIIYIIFNFHLAENFKDSEKDAELNISTFTKFLVNHSQQVSAILISSKIPVGSLPSFFQTFDYISFSNENVMTNECLVQKFFYEKELFLIMKEIFNLIMPILFCFISFAALTIFLYTLSFTNKFHYMFNKIPKNFNQFKGKVILLMIISTIMLYPLILKSCFSLFNCIKMDEDDSVTFLKESPNLQCWGLTHSYYIAFLGVPGILVWGVSFPFFLTMILRKSQKLKGETTNNFCIERNENKKKFIPSFTKFPAGELPPDILNTNSKINKKEESLFNNVFKVSNKLKNKENPQNTAVDLSKSSRAFIFFYRNVDFKNNFYYWESLIFFRKFCITFISTFDETGSIEVQTSILLVLLITYIHYTAKKWPYKENLCNHLEMISLYTLGITIFSNFIFHFETYKIFKIFFLVATSASNFILYSIAGYKIAKFVKTITCIHRKKIQSMIGKQVEKIRSARNSRKPIINIKNQAEEKLSANVIR